MQYILVNGYDFIDGEYVIDIPSSCKYIEIYDSNGNSLNDSNIINIKNGKMTLISENFINDYFPIRIVFVDSNDIFGNYINLFDVIKTKNPDESLRIAVGRKNNPSKNITVGEFINQSTQNLPYLSKNPLNWNIDGYIAREKLSTPSVQYVNDLYNSKLHLSSYETIEKRGTSFSDMPSESVTYDCKFTKYNDDSVFVDLTIDDIRYWWGTHNQQYPEYIKSRAIKLFSMGDVGLVSGFGSPIILNNASEEYKSHSYDGTVMPVFIVITAGNSSFNIAGYNMEPNSVYVYLPLQNWYGRELIHKTNLKFSGTYFGLADIQL